MSVHEISENFRAMCALMPKLQYVKIVTYKELHYGHFLGIHECLEELFVF